VPTLGRLAAVTVPSLVLALAGLLVHPSHLDSGTAHRWAALHIVLLPVFPLVAAGFVVPLLGRPRGVAAVVAWIAAFAYACFYTGLDAVAGIAAGTAVDQSPQPVDRGLLVDPLYEVGNRIGRIGATAFIVAAVATCAALWGRHGLRIVPGGVVLLVAGWSFLDSHMFWPRGVFTTLGFAVGFALLLWATTVGRSGPPAPAAGPANRNRPRTDP
jgi:hypothetical protein